MSESNKRVLEPTCTENTSKKIRDGTKPPPSVYNLKAGLQKLADSWLAEAAKVSFCICQLNSDLIMVYASVRSIRYRVVVVLIGFGLFVCISG